MEFDINKVYTAVNAEELKVGSRCIFANSLGMLKERFLNVEGFSDTLHFVCNESAPSRFICNNNSYLLAYLIEPAKEPEYKPFSSVEKAIETIREHGCFLQSEKIYSFIATHLTNCDCVYLGGYWLTLKDLYEDFIFADDGSPCGELVEE